jgi:hypothetical protein
MPVHNARQFGALFFHLGIEGNGLLFGRRHGASSACFFDGHSLAVAVQQRYVDSAQSLPDPAARLQSGKHTACHLPETRR